MYQCPNCGAEVHERDVVCDQCGFELQGGQQGPPPQGGRQGQPPQGGQQGPPPQGGQPRGRTAPQRGAQADDGIDRRTLLAGGGVAVAAAAGGWFFFLSGDGNDGPSPDEPGESIDDAPMISAGEHGPYEITDGESHFFAIELDEGDELAVTMEFSHDDGDLDLAIHDPDENQIGSSISTTDDENVSVNADQSGTYYILPNGFGGATNEYTLDIEVN